MHRALSGPRLGGAHRSEGCGRWDLSSLGSSRNIKCFALIKLDHPEVVRGGTGSSRTSSRSYLLSGNSSVPLLAGLAIRKFTHTIETQKPTLLFTSIVKSNNEEDECDDEEMNGDTQNIDHFDAENESMRASLLPLSVPTRRTLHVFSKETLVVVWEFIRPFGNYLAYFTLLAMLVLVPLVLYGAFFDKKLEKAALHSAGIMVSGTVILSFRLVYLHLTHWYMPLQKFVVRILFMVPIYAVISYLSLQYHEHRVYMGTIRDFYEAFVIASFVYYLIELLGGDEPLIQLLRSKDPTMGKHHFPLKFALDDWEMGEEFMLHCKHGVLQYVVFKTIATIITFVCEFMGVYGEGEFHVDNAYPYLCFFQNISVMYALYCLVLFFHAVCEELRHPINWYPLGKFMCVKGVVFFTWWQGVLIYQLKDQVFHGGGGWSTEDVANGLIDYCIVVEMVGFAIAHSFTFTYTEYLPGSLPHASNPVVGPGSIDEEHQGSYCPPPTLNEPLAFKDAFWSSTVPKETLHDIRRLRSETMRHIRRIRSGMLEGRSETATSAERPSD